MEVEERNDFTSHVNDFYIDAIGRLFESIRQRVNLKKRKNNREDVLYILDDLEHDLMVIFGIYIDKIYNDAYNLAVANMSKSKL